MMGRIDEILAKQAQLATELEAAKEEERDAVLQDITAKIKMFGFKASDFRGLLKSRISKKQAEEFLAKKATVVAKKPAAKKAKS
jgi:hypothetical protein